MSNSSTAEIFNRHWSTYQKVIAANYMLHKQFGTATFSAIQRETAVGPLCLLDLGCGDAALMADFLLNLPVNHYAGYDLSPSALGLARHNLGFLQKRLTLIEGPMEAMLPQEQHMFNIIHSSFAIHHLRDDQKGFFFNEIVNHLSEGGLFIYVDTYRQSGVHRSACIADYIAWMNSTWNKLKPEELETIEEHVSSFDHPASLELIEEIAVQAGLNVEEKLTDDPRHFYMTFRKKD